MLILKINAILEYIYIFPSFSTASSYPSISGTNVFTEISPDLHFLEKMYKYILVI